MFLARNLQYLRKRDKITQEDLADRLGVSRQSVSKWETDEAYPETEKLLALCDLFAVSLDDLMRRDLTQADEAAEEQAPSAQADEAEGRAYIAHMNKFARGMAFGVALILFGVAVCMVISGYAQSGPHGNLFAVLGGVAVLLFVAAAVFLFVYHGMAHDRFQKEHPAIDNPFSEEESKAFSKKFSVAMACLVSGILLAVAALIIFATLLEEGIIAEGTYRKDVVSCYIVAGFLAVLSCLVGGLVYFGIQFAKYDIASYNKQIEHERGRGSSRFTGAINGTIMLTATAIFLVIGFVWNLWHPGWLVYPVGGILCAIVNTIAGAVSGKKK